MVVPVVFGLPLHLWLGILLLLLILLQVGIGSGVIRMPFVWHRRNGYVILLIALIHAFFGLGIWFWGFKIG